MPLLPCQSPPTRIFPPPVLPVAINLELFSRVMWLAVMRILPPWVAPMDSRTLEMLVLPLFADVVILPPRPLPPFVCITESKRLKLPARLRIRIEPPFVLPFARKPLLMKLILSETSIEMVPPGPFEPLVWMVLGPSNWAVLAESAKEPPVVPFALIAPAKFASLDAVMEMVPPGPLLPLACIRLPDSAVSVWAVK
ncbi:hypothetical protein POBR111598_10070 [Polynucleobacter brandtiae]